MSSSTRAFFAALLICVFSVALFWPREAPVSQEPVNGRLPDLAVPDDYLLRLSIFPDQAQFRGEVEIGLQLHASSRSIYLHGRDLAVHKVEARRAGKDAVIGHYQQLTPQGLARIDFEQKLPAGFLTLVMHYDGQYTNTSEGLSRMQVGDDWYVFSQLHPIEARRVFPSFDEPRFKATFELEIISWQQDAVIGNSLPSETRQLPNQLKLTRLNQTPRLPTFLLNISVGPFDVVNGPEVPPNEVRSQPLAVRAITTRGEGKRTRFALDHTAAMLRNFEQYFAIPFPFDKLDLIAVPDSSASVLENPGAINFREQLMLVEEHATPQQRQDFIAYHAHALAHQWFGDLVTVRWWDDLWLNEGFAEWLAYEIASQTYPEYPLSLTMQRQQEQAMQRDGLSPLVRIQQTISREQDVQSTFNTVIYDKAMGLMRMYQRYLGSEQFRQGLRNYFARHAFGNAGATELFQSLSDSIADPAVANSVDSFLLQPGLPQVELQQRCENGQLQLHLKQSAYQPAGSPEIARHWHLPMCLRTHGDTPQACRLFNAPELDWSPGWRCDELVLPNADGAGYYRWQISAEHRQALLAKLNELHLPEVIDIVANLDAAMRAGRLGPAELWHSLPAIAAHPEPAVLQTALETWRYLLHVLPAAQQQHWQHQLQAVFRTPELVSRHDEAIWRFRSIELQDAELRQQLLRKHAEDVQALQRGGDFSDTPDTLALTIALASQPDLQAALIARVQQENRSDVRAALIAALADQRSPAFLRSVQELLLSPTLRVHERWTLLRASLLNPSLGAAHWQWLRQDADKLLPMLPAYRHSQLPELAESLCDVAQWQQTEAFLRERAERLVIPDSTLVSTASHVQQCLALRTAFSGAEVGAR